jgi:hypothetical protein
VAACETSHVLEPLWWESRAMPRGSRFVTQSSGSEEAARRAGRPEQRAGTGPVCSEVGTERPLVLLQELLVSVEMFAPVAWAAEDQLIVPDLPGHGRSADLAGPTPSPSSHLTLRMC